jgi:hypothetical protein
MKRRRPSRHLKGQQRQQHRGMNPSSRVWRLQGGPPCVRLQRHHQAALDARARGHNAAAQLKVLRTQVAAARLRMSGAPCCADNGTHLWRTACSVCQ